LQTKTCLKYHSIVASILFQQLYYLGLSIQVTQKSRATFTGAVWNFDWREGAKWKMLWRYFGDFFRWRINDDVTEM